MNFLEGESCKMWVHQASVNNDLAKSWAKSSWNKTHQPLNRPWSAHGSPLWDTGMPEVTPDGCNFPVNKVSSRWPLLPVTLAFPLLQKCGFAGHKTLFCNAAVSSWWEEQVDTESRVSWRWYKSDRSWAGDKIMSSVCFSTWQEIEHTNTDWKLYLLHVLFLSLSPWTSWVWPSLFLFSPMVF